MTTEKNNTTAIAKVSYILLIIGTLVGITGVIALIMAYAMQKTYADGNWIQTHYRFQIRTFWIGLLYATIGLITINLLIGFFILLYTFVWLIVRCTKGLNQLENAQPVKNLESWFFT